MAGWRVVPLGEALTFQRGFDITKVEQSDGPYWVISSSGRQSRHNKFMVPGPGVVIGRKGTLGSVYFSAEDFWPHDTTLWVKDFHGNDAKFAFYFLHSMNFERLDAGASNPTLNRNHIHTIPVLWPDVPTQRRIAGILSAYDDLIENCERRIRVLDEMARSLYREWFLDFRVPGASGSGMPKAWKSVTAASLVQEFRRGVPKGPMSASLPYVGLEHIPRRSLALNDWIETAELGSNKLRFEPGEVLFGKIRPYFHKVAVAPFVGVCSADTFVVSSIRPEHWAFVTCLVSSDVFVAHASATANGAKMPRANWEVLMEFPVAVPPDELVAKFAAIVDPCIQQQMQLVRQAKNLRATRDLLLPRLLSGQLSVDDAA